MAQNNTENVKSVTTKQTGNVGEQIAVKYLKSKGFKVIETNYYKKWGELDIVASNKAIIHFIEVKTQSFTSKEALYNGLTGDNWRPEEQVHHFKIHQIEKALESWLAENDWEGEWQIDVVSVRLVHDEQYAVVDHIENIIAE